MKTTNQTVDMKESNLSFMVRPSLYRTGLHWNVPKYVSLTGNTAAFIFLICWISIGINIVISLDNRQALIDSFTVLSFCLVGFYKFVSIKINMRPLKLMVREVENLEILVSGEGETCYKDEYDTDDENTVVAAEYIDKYNNKIRSFGRGLLIFYWSTLVVYDITPFFEYILVRYRNINAELPHILPTWTPFGDNFIGYIILTIVEIVASIYCVGVHTAFDIFMISFMIFISGQFTLLRARIINIAGSGSTYTLLKSRDDRALYRIKECHRHHVRLIKLVRKLEKILQPVMGFYFSLATLTFCATAIQLTTNISKLQMLSLLQYMFATLTQLFLYCRYGDSVVQESEMSKGDGAFASAWWSLSPRIRKELIVLIAGTSRSMSFKAGWFHSLQLPSFMSIVQTAYSYYAVLSKNS